MKRHSRSLDDTREIAQQFLDALKRKEKTATIVGLRGELGSGKTTFVQQIAKLLGVEETVTSPTFVILKRYTLDKNDFDSLYHIDAYRLESGKELKTLGWDEIIENPKNLIFIEWPERVRDILPKDISNMSFTFIDEETRDIVLA